MWFISNGHPAKSQETEREVSDDREAKKAYTKEFKQDAVNTLFCDYQFSPSSSK